MPGSPVLRYTGVGMEVSLPDQLDFSLTSISRTGRLWLLQPLQFTFQMVGREHCGSGVPLLLLEEMLELKKIAPTSPAQESLRTWWQPAAVPVKSSV